MSAVRHTGDVYSEYIHNSVILATRTAIKIPCWLNNGDHSGWQMSVHPAGKRRC